MRCGEKRFFVEIETNENKQQLKTVNARTPAEARRRVRIKCGEQTNILAVRRAGRNQTV